MFFLFDFVRWWQKSMLEAYLLQRQQSGELTAMALKGYRDTLAASRQSALLWQQLHPGVTLRREGNLVTIERVFPLVHTLGARPSATILAFTRPSLR